MMQSSFKILFRVEVLHSYFEQNICTCLRLTPGNVTAGLLKRFDFKTNNNANFFELFVNTQGPVAALLDYIKEVTSQTFFEFELSATHPKFIFFTDMSLSSLDKLVFDSAAASNTYSNGSVILAEGFSSNSPFSGMGSLVVRFDDILNAPVANECVKFTIQFKARPTQWQYFIINKSTVRLDNPAIKGTTDIGFEGPEYVTIENGQQAILFSSGSNLIPLSAVAKYKFDLVNNPVPANGGAGKKTASAKIVFKGLPNPDPERIGLKNISGVNSVLSPMYVYV